MRGGAGRRPISPRAPERRGRWPPGALGSPAAFPSDMLPGREEETDSEVNRGDEHAEPGQSPTHPAGCPSVSGVPPAAIQLLPPQRGGSGDHLGQIWRALSPGPGCARGSDAPQRSRAAVPHRARSDFSSGATRSRPWVSAPGGSLRGGTRAPPSCREAEVRSVGGAGHSIYPAAPRSPPPSLPGSSRSREKLG